MDFKLGEEKDQVILLTEEKAKLEEEYRKIKVKVEELENNVDLINIQTISKKFFINFNNKYTEYINTIKNLMSNSLDPVDSITKYLYTLHMRIDELNYEIKCITNNKLDKEKLDIESGLFRKNNQLFELIVSENNNKRKYTDINPENTGNLFFNNAKKKINGQINHTIKPISSQINCLLETNSSAVSKELNDVVNKNTLNKLGNLNLIKNPGIIQTNNIRKCKMSNSFLANLTKK